MRAAILEEADGMAGRIDTGESMPQTSKLGVTNYLLKLVNENLVTEDIERFKKKQNSNHQATEALLYNFYNGAFNEMKLSVPTTKGFIVLKMDDIILLEAERNYTIIHLHHKKTVTVSRTLLEYERILGNTGFLRVHRTFLINLQHVTEYHRGEGGTAIMSNGTEVEISRRRKEQFITRIKEGARH